MPLGLSLKFDPYLKEVYRGSLVHDAPEKEVDDVKA